MLLQGSCHCGAVSFRCRTRHPQPYQRCYCSICRKTGGGGGFLINTLADATTLEVEGREHAEVYRAALERDGEAVRSRHERHFCRKCGSHLWAFNTRWPELLHPVATAIDTPLPEPPENVHMMVASKPDWIRVEGKPGDVCFDEYPEESLADWHEQRDLTVG